MPRALRFLLLLILLATALAAQARVREEQLDVPVRVTDAYGKTIEQTIKVTVFRDDTGPVPAPVAILNHGRAPQPADRAKLGRARYPDAARWLVTRGFIVAIPTRVGYGVSGGEDVEDSGHCGNKRYPPGYAAAAQQTVAVLETMRQRADTQKDRAIVLGQSYGGTTAIAVAALNPSAVQLAINFAGGGGGDPQGRPQEPCAPQRLELMFKEYGRSARIPTLWIYSENDMYMGPKYPRDWYQAFINAGGRGEFVQFPSQPEDGHLLFSRHPELWQPRVAEFLDAHGFSAPPREQP